MKLNNTLKARIIERYGTCVDFAEAARIDASLVSRIIRGRRALPPEEQERWAALLDAKPKELFKEQPA